MAKNDRYIKQTRDGTWAVVKEGHRRGATQETKKQAVDRARRIVRNEGGGEIRVLNGAGKIVDSKTVARAPRSQQRSGSA